jgi:hypothetical protein
MKVSIVAQGALSVRQSSEIQASAGRVERECAFLRRSRTAEPTLTAERWFLSVCYRNPNVHDLVDGDGSDPFRDAVLTHF